MKMDSVAVNGGGASGADFSKRGTKRDASDSRLDGDFERFSKRLHLLSLRSEQNELDKSNLYTPISNASATPNGVSHTNHAPDEDELMQVDDTRDRVYIHDLDAELAEADPGAEEEKLIFLPDIEKHFSKIPQQVLMGRKDDSEHQELVLYEVPKSLTVDEEHDSVRKLILEARHRAREKALEESRHADMNRKYDQSDYENSMETAHGYTTGYADPEADDYVDPDAMDLG